MISGMQMANMMVWEDYVGRVLFGKDILLIFTRPGSEWRTCLKGTVLSVTMSGGPYPHLKKVEVAIEDMMIFNHREKKWNLYREATRLVIGINHSEIGLGLKFLEFSSEKNNLFPGRKLNGQITL